MDCFRCTGPLRAPRIKLDDEERGEHGDGLEAVYACPNPACPVETIAVRFAHAEDVVEIVLAHR